MNSLAVGITVKDYNDVLAVKDLFLTICHELFFVYLTLGVLSFVLYNIGGTPGSKVSSSGPSLDETIILTFLTGEMCLRGV